MGQWVTNKIYSVHFLTVSVSFEIQKNVIIKKCNWVSGSPSILYKLVLGPIPIVHTNFQENPLKELGTSRTHSAVIRCLTICQHIPVVRKNHKNQLTQQFDIICCLARGLTLCIESKQIMSLLSCESATLKRGPQLCGQRCGPYLRH